MNKTTYFIDHLTTITWLQSVLPVLFHSRIMRRSIFPMCYFVDGSLSSVLIARTTAALLGIKLERLTFKLTEVVEEDGTQSHLLVTYQGLNDARKEMTTESLIKRLHDDSQLTGRLVNYLGKSAVNGEPGERGSIGHAQYMAHVCCWKNRVEGAPSNYIILFQESFPWFDQAINYAATKGVTLIRVRSKFSVKDFVRRRLPRWVLQRLQSIRLGRKSVSLTLGIHPGVGGKSNPTLNYDGLYFSKSAPKYRLLVESNGMLNINRPELHSDLFFWQKSPLSGQDIVLTFAIPQVPLDTQQWQELNEHHMSAIVLHPRASVIPSSCAPYFNPPKRFEQAMDISVQTPGFRIEKRWLKEQHHRYRELRNYWSKLCSDNNIKLMITQNKYDASHCAIADALQDNGGVLALYQRAFESDPSPITTVSADIVFGFSNITAEVERKSGSTAQFHIATGYLGDHRIPLLRKSAQIIRQDLRSNGAKHIMAFFDENSREDARWHLSHQDMRDNFRFLLQKVLDEPWFGLVIKPKLPRHLRMRLGSTSKMLDHAVATGRCRIFDDSGFRGFHPPVAAALAADIAVHGHLTAATAGVESALAGTPTLLLDKEGWRTSRFYKLGVGKTVFTNWESLWSACLEQWSNDSNSTGIGDWTIMLDDIDPFRDGRAAERMGTYMHWMLESFKSGADRDVAMADAAHKYAELWGHDKVTDINWNTVSNRMNGVNS